MDRPWYLEVVLPVLELKEYLGGSFDPALCTGNDKLVAQEAAHYASPLDFYRHGRIYLYHLTFVGMDVWRDVMLSYVLKTTKPCDILDFGCGIGSTGLLMTYYGYDPAFADFPSESMKYLKWRLRRRELEAPVYKIGQDEIPHHSLVLALDVLEHVPPEQQEKFLTQLAEYGNEVVINMLGDSEKGYGDNGNIHYGVNTTALLEWLEQNFDVRDTQSLFSMENMIAVRYGKKNDEGSR